MDTFKTHLVFTPTSPAKLSFVERESKVNDELVDALKIPGMQIILYGPSGAGKTTLLINKVNQLYENHIITRCMIGMSMEQIILDGFDQLNPFYTSEYTSSKKNSISTDLISSYASLKVHIEKQLQESSKRILPIQLTPQRLAYFFGNSNCCWILEDFHKIENSEKTKLSQIMKVFMDTSIDYPELKIIAVGAVNSARDVAKYDPEMRQRVSEIFVPLMSDNEIAKIIYKGEELINLKLKSSVARRILKFSCGLPSVCHHLCLIMCTNLGIYSTLDNTITFSEEDFDRAVEKYIKTSSDSLKEIFDKAVKVDRVRTYNNPTIILDAILELGKDEMTYKEILSKIHKKMPEYPRGNLTAYLNQFQLPKRGEILRYDKNSGKYSFASPFVKSYAHCVLTKKMKKTSLEDFNISTDEFTNFFMKMIKNSIEKSK